MSFGPWLICRNEAEDEERRKPPGEKFPGKIKSVEPGDLIREKPAYQRDPEDMAELHTYRVAVVYPWHVLTEDTVTGLLRCFSYGDLIVMGLERQEAHLEAMRYGRKDLEGRRWSSRW